MGKLTYCSINKIFLQSPETGDILFPHRRKNPFITKSMGHHTLKGVVCDRPSILGTSELKVLTSEKARRLHFVKNHSLVLEHRQNSHQEF